MSVTRYDIRRDVDTKDDDGLPIHTWSTIETRNIEVQPVRFSAERGSTVLTIEVGGEKYVPSFRGWLSVESNVTATDRITNNSATTELLVLRTYDYEDHKEIDLKDIKDR